jgi:SAM-dependent methyltransferase
MGIAKKLRKKWRRWRGTSSHSRPRRDTLLSRIDVATQTGLEIGPLSHPLVTKAESNGQIFYVDSATAEQLREKYRGDAFVKADAIVETDYLWGRQTLPELVHDKAFDYVLASHVIEHVPNLIGWLREVATILRDDGILSLAIPDKRYTFDLKRELTSFGALAESFLLDRRRPSVRDVFDHKALATHVDLFKVWDRELDMSTLKNHESWEAAWRDTQGYQASDAYVDVHVTIVTPASFLDILDGINRLGLLDFSVVNFVDTERYTLEFFVALQRTPRHLSRDEALARQRDSIAAARGQLRH